MSDKETYIKRYEAARAEMREIVKLAQGNQTIYQPWRMKEVLDHITGWDDAVIASPQPRQHPAASTRTTQRPSHRVKPSPTK